MEEVSTDVAPGAIGHTRGRFDTAILATPSGRDRSTPRPAKDDTFEDATNATDADEVAMRRDLRARIVGDPTRSPRPCSTQTMEPTTDSGETIDATVVQDRLPDHRVKPISERQLFESSTSWRAQAGAPRGQHALTGLRSPAPALSRTVGPEPC